MLIQHAVVEREKYYLNWKLIDTDEDCHAVFEQLHQADLWRSYLIRHELTRYVSVTKCIKQETFEDLH